MAGPLPQKLLDEALRLYDIYGSIRVAASHATKQDGTKGIHHEKFRLRLRKARARQPSADTSTLYRMDTGAPVLQWVKAKGKPGQEALLEGLRDLFDEYKGRARPSPPPPATNADLLTLYPIADMHLGMYAWAEETGEDYDVEIARAVLREAVSDLVERSPPAETAVVLNLGDYYHMDNSSNQTTRSRHSLDVDTRYSRVARVGVGAMIDAIEIAAAKHKRVIVRCLSGNHDDESGMWLAIALGAFFQGNDRITVDESPSPFWFHRFGETFLAATHGHMARGKDMAGLMAAQRAQDWGKSTWRYGHYGHIHHRTALPVTEANGVEVESHQTLAAKDAWGAASGFSSNRGMAAITYHRENGEVERHRHKIKPGTRDQAWLKASTQKNTSKASPKKRSACVE